MFNLYAIFKHLGSENSINLRERAPSMTATEIIENEVSIPNFNPHKDYTGMPVGTPVSYAGQVWSLIQPHNASLYDGTPETLRSLWGLLHTKNPDSAKPWVDPLGTSGMYMTGECYVDDSGIVWIALHDNVSQNASVAPNMWKEHK